MEIRVNGERREIGDGLHMEQVLAALEVPTHSGVAVLRNGEVVRRADWARTPVQPEDELEIVRATAGG